MYSQKQIIDFIAKNKPILEQEFHISRIGLFGSFARNEQSSDSDLDLVIEFEENTENLFEVKMAVKKFFKEKLDINIDICREKYIKPIFKERILKEAIYVE
jgi:hypothetical protein